MKEFRRHLYHCKVIMILAFGRMAYAENGDVAPCLAQIWAQHGLRRLSTPATLPLGFVSAELGKVENHKQVRRRVRYSKSEVLGVPRATRESLEAKSYNNQNSFVLCVQKTVHKVDSVHFISQSHLSGCMIKSQTSNLDDAGRSPLHALLNKAEA